MTDWQVGDLAVCVDMSQPVNISVPPIETLFTMRGVYRVAEVRPSSMGQLLRIADRGQWVWNATRFRKIVKADSDFIEQMRAIKPKADA